MTDSVQLSDQFLLGSSLKTDSETLISKGKNVVYVSDIQQGSYESGLITIDATNQLNGSQGFASLREAYLTVPYVITARNTGTQSAGRLSRFACSLKTGIWNVISDLQVELNGKQVLTTNEYKNFWNNLRAMTEYGVGDLQKHGADSFLQPDDWYSINCSSSASSNGDGYANNSVGPLVGKDATLGQTQEHRAFNEGLFKRLVSSTPMIVDSTTHDTFGWASLKVAAQKQIVQQHGRGCFIETGGTNAGDNAGTWIFMLKIRLTDLHPLLKELDLMANPQIKLTYKVNSGKVEIAGGTDSMSLVSSTIKAGNVCPIIIASAATGNPMNNVFTIADGSKMSFSFGVLQNDFTNKSEIGAYLPYSTTRLNIPFYDIEDPRPIISKPVKTVRYLDCFAQYFRTGGGVGVVEGHQNASFTYQINASLKNLKYVALLPFAETSAGHWTSAHGTEQFASPFDSAPWTCQPGDSVRNFQVQVGNKNVFAKTHEYDYESFMDEFCKLSAINGDNTREMSNGLIDLDKWSFAHRIMVADCSRVSAKDVPAAIQVSGTNSCSQGSRYLILCVYERELSYDRLTGEVEFFN